MRDGQENEQRALSPYLNFFSDKSGDTPGGRYWDEDVQTQQQFWAV